MHIVASPPKEINICESLPIYTLYDMWDDALPDSPPKKKHQKLRILAHACVARDLGRHPARQAESKKPAIPHPYTWSKDPYS